MNILIATGIFYPELGGPATYTPALAQALIAQGHQVSVVTYSDTKSHPDDATFTFSLIRIFRTNKISNYFRYALALWQQRRTYDVIYAMDHLSAGLPAVLIGTILQKPVSIRVGGDFLWERYLRLNNKAVALASYYEQGLYRRDWLRYAIIRFVFSVSTHVIFTTTFQSTLFQMYYAIPEKKIAHIANPVPSIISAKEVPHYRGGTKDILFAGRINAKNNVERLLRVWLSLPDQQYRLVFIGQGEELTTLQSLIPEEDKHRVSFEPPCDRHVLWERMAICYGVIFSSLTDISPNTMLDCLLVGTPFITSKYIGYEWVLHHMPSFDPCSDEDMAHAIHQLLTPQGYEAIQKQMAHIEYTYQFDDAAKDTVAILQNRII